MIVRLGLIYNKLTILSFERFRHNSQYSQFLCERSNLPGVIVKGSFCNEDTCMVNRSTFFFSLFPSTMRLFSAKYSFLKQSVFHDMTTLHCSDRQYNSESLQWQTKKKKDNDITKYYYTFKPLAKRPRGFCRAVYQSL